MRAPRTIKYRGQRYVLAATKPAPLVLQIDKLVKKYKAKLTKIGKSASGQSDRMQVSGFKNGKSMNDFAADLQALFDAATESHTWGKVAHRNPNNNTVTYLS